MNELVAALCKAQQSITSPPRNKEVRVQTKGGVQYKFKYATLDAIIDHVRRPLTENGLWFTQTLVNGDGKYKLVTTLLHSSGQSIASETPLLVQGAAHQDFGSALTYMRRYALTAMLGIAADEDDDGNGADGNTITDTKDIQKREGPKGSHAPDWHGPLNKTQLKDKIHVLRREVEACEDEEQLLAYLRSAEKFRVGKDEISVTMQQVIDQCEKDWPNCYHPYGDSEGLKAFIDKKFLGLQKESA